MFFRPLADRWPSSPLSRSPAPDRRILTSPVPASPTNPLRRLIHSPSPLTQSQYACAYPSDLTRLDRLVCLRSAQRGAEDEAGEEKSQPGVTRWGGIGLSSQRAQSPVTDPRLARAIYPSCAFYVNKNGLRKVPPVSTYPNHVTFGLRMMVLERCLPAPVRIVPDSCFVHQKKKKKKTHKMIRDSEWSPAKQWQLRFDGRALKEPLLTS